MFYHAHQDPDITKQEVEKISNGKIKVDTSKGMVKYLKNSLNKNKTKMKKSQLKQLIKEELFLLQERVVNLHNKQDITKYIDDIWDIMQLTYKPIGGFLTASSKEELISKVDFAKVIRKDNKIVAAALYKDKFGRKAIAKGFDGTEVGKAAVKMIYKEDVEQKDRNSWGEFSGGAERQMLKNGGIPIPNTLVGEILGKPIIVKNPDGFHYTREINGEEHEKIMIGNIKR